MGLFDLLFKGNIFGRTTVSRDTEDRIKIDWEKINQLQKLGGPSNLRQALITADRTLDNVLKELYKGESMGERLKEAKDRFDRPTYNLIWDAHKIRNSLVHEAGYEPPYYVVNKAIDDLRSVIASFGVSL